MHEQNKVMVVRQQAVYGYNMTAAFQKGVENASLKTAKTGKPQPGSQHIQIHSKCFKKRDMRSQSEIAKRSGYYDRDTRDTTRNNRPQTYMALKVRKDSVAAF